MAWSSIENEMTKIMLKITKHTKMPQSWFGLQVLNPSKSHFVVSWNRATGESSIKKNGIFHEINQTASLGYLHLFTPPLQNPNRAFAPKNRPPRHFSLTSAASLRTSDIKLRSATKPRVSCAVPLVISQGFTRWISMNINMKISMNINRGDYLVISLHPYLVYFIEIGEIEHQTDNEW